MQVLLPNTAVRLSSLFSSFVTYLVLFSSYIIVLSRACTSDGWYVHTELVQRREGGRDGDRCGAACILRSQCSHT